MRLALPLACVALVAGLAVPAVGAGAPAAPAPKTVRAGVGVVDATWNVGASSGQYADPTEIPQNAASGGELDPQAQDLLKTGSYGVQSRLSVRALVVEGTDGGRVALVKTDNYLAQDLLVRRVAQLLEAGDSGIGYDDILHSAAHNHSSPYQTTTSPGVWAFQTNFDQRMLEYSARQMAKAIELAADRLVPARMGATDVPFDTVKGNIVGPALADDGSPAGYPRDYGDNSITVLRFDDISVPSAPKPLAVWMNHGQHPESLDGYKLTSGDYLAPLERFVQRDLGAPLLFSQGDVGSAEGPYLRDDYQTLPNGTIRAYAHAGYAQAERGARLLADAVRTGWQQIGAGTGKVAFSSSFPVSALTRAVPGPLSHPYPSVSNCSTAKTYEGDPGVPAAGLPDCARADQPRRANPVVDALRAEGVPVPAQYDAPGYPAVEENNRMRLQVVRLGEVLLASCACEAQVDLVLNLESRADDVPGNIYDGYDWGASCTRAGADWRCPTPAAPGGVAVVSDAAKQRMEAQVHNDARGWDDPSYVLQAGSEPTDPALIKGNFTKEELPPAQGYKLAVGVGHATDYNGYTVSYREYMSRDSYRKALTAYGPHTADYMVTRLVRMAGSLKGGPAYDGEPQDALADADEARQTALATAIGAESGPAYDAYLAALPDDVGPVAPLAQPASLQRFGAATFTWRGGSNAVDNPVVRVERQVGGAWQPYADMSGEVQTQLALPRGVQGVAQSWQGSFEWKWTAQFEAFTGFPATMGQTPAGSYRFVVAGVSRAGRTTQPYALTSAPFTVSPWQGVQVSRVTAAADRVTVDVAPVVYPRTYASPIRFVADDGSKVLCKTCTFRPWASTADVASVAVTVMRAGKALVVPATLVGGRWVAAVKLKKGDVVSVEPGGVRDRNGETNGARVLAT